VYKDHGMATGKSITKLRALQLSLIATASIVVIEGTVGFLTNSLAILGDAAHAVFDTITVLILLATTQLSMQPADEEHLYGHGKIESIGGLIGGIALIGLALLLFYEAGTRILSPQRVNNEIIGFGAVGYTLVIDFFRIGTLWGRSQSSLTVRATLYHALSDLASTIIALIGFSLASYRITGTDAAASIVLATLLIYLSARLVRTSGAELSDAISKSVVEEIRKQILSTGGVTMCKDLKARRVGTKTFVETTICVPGSMGLAEAHNVASQIESKVVGLYGDSSVTVHIEPSGPENPIEKQIESLAAAVEGVKGVHNLSNVYSKGKLFITLHVMVDPSMSLERAHAIAEKIEKDLKQQIGDIENVTIHIEPYELEISGEFLLKDAQVEMMIRQILEAHSDIRSVKRVVTYVSEKRRHINIDCSFDKTVLVEVMHDTVSHVEAEIKEQFKEAVVTIHAEPSP
jgi:cation diffusion facilitator family transporter